MTEQQLARIVMTLPTGWRQHAQSMDATRSCKAIAAAIETLAGMSDAKAISQYKVQLASISRARSVIKKSPKDVRLVFDGAESVSNVYNRLRLTGKISRGHLAAVTDLQHVNVAQRDRLAAALQDKGFGPVVIRPSSLPHADLRHECEVVFGQVSFYKLAQIGGIK